MDWFLYDNGPRHERVNLVIDFENLYNGECRNAKLIHRDTKGNALHKWLL